jgi:hypothetical protein
MPQLVQNTLSELTMAVEEECPVAKAFGFQVLVKIVWSVNVNGTIHRFKVKVSYTLVLKLRHLQVLMLKKLGSIQKFVEYAVTESRLNNQLRIYSQITNR